MSKNFYMYMIVLIIFIFIISFYNEYSSEHSKEGYQIINNKKRNRK
jgi:hypothetical protein